MDPLAAVEAEGHTATSFALPPGKTSLTQRLARPDAAAPPVAAPAIDPAAATRRAQIEHDTAGALGFAGGPAATIDRSCQRMAQAGSDGHTGLTDQAVSAHAAAGVAGAGGALPHLDVIQRAFGPHDVTSVRAHVGGAAADAAQAIGAHAYATGDQVAFAGAPDLFLAAHEATHVVQQRQGVQLKGAVGQDGDDYERHADQVAAAVVRGEHVAGLLGGGGHDGPDRVQRKAPAKPKVTMGSSTTCTLVVEGAKLEGDRHVIPVGGACTVRLDRKTTTKEPDPGLSIKAVETGELGAEAAAGVDAFDVSKGAWDGQDVVWTITGNRPGVTTVTFSGAQDGAPLFEDQRTFACVAKGSDGTVVDLVQDAEIRATKRLGQAADWAMGLVESYTVAHRRLEDTVAKDAAAAAMVESVFWSAVTMGVGAVAGPLAKTLLVSGDEVQGLMKTFVKAMKEDLASDAAKLLIGTASSTAQAARALDAEGPANPRDPLATMVAVQKRIAGWQVDVADALEVMKAHLKKAARIEHDPRHVIDLFFDGFGFPWTVPSDADLEKRMWEVWLTKNPLQTWYGLNKRRVMARLDELGVAYTHPDASYEPTVSYGGA